MMGTVSGLFTTTAAGEPMIAHEAVTAIPGQGLAGDRYALGTGFYSERPLPGGARELTLIETESLEAVARETGQTLTPLQARRNIATSGIRLSELVGKRFRIGSVLCEGVRDCPPCEHLDELTGMQMLGPLARRGGLRANILSPGEIRIGDEIIEGDA